MAQVPANAGPNGTTASRGKGNAQPGPFFKGSRDAERAANRGSALTHIPHAVTGGRFAGIEADAVVFDHEDGVGGDPGQSDPGLFGARSRGDVLRRPAREMTALR